MYGIRFAFVVLAIGFLFGAVIPVHAQFSSENPLLQAIPKFQFSNDSLLNRIAPNTDFGWKIKTVQEDISEIFTFDKLKKAELILQHAKERQNEINDLDERGLPIPIELEERRIEKLNTARLLIEEKDDSILSKSFSQLREMGELNDIRVLYSQLPSVVNADEKTKQDYNEKVNSLLTWKNNCMGEFNVDDMKPLNKAVEKLEKQCPKLIDLQKKFGYERIKLLVSGTV